MLGWGMGKVDTFLTGNTKLIQTTTTHGYCVIKVLGRGSQGGGKSPFGENQIKETQTRIGGKVMKVISGKTNRNCNYNYCYSVTVVQNYLLYKKWRESW